MNCPSSSSDSIFRIELPNGKTTVISHGNQDLKQLLEKVCIKLAVQPEFFELIRGNDGEWKLLMREEYEVRGVTPYAPEGADIGDVVISVDGKLISQVSFKSWNITCL
ncbi:unnamed protein product [Strongylus vulgaris]|uniref:Uncharacterized protein n=1 Tax=Strongylus vulgaris TaxID=40348 RepID=A0A3P7LCV0_STRVU|nr:unnamed protein product [Strongylus vulgaris]